MRPFKKREEVRLEKEANAPKDSCFFTNAAFCGAKIPFQKKTLYLTPKTMHEDTICTCE